MWWYQTVLYILSILASSAEQICLNQWREFGAGQSNDRWRSVLENNSKAVIIFGSFDWWHSSFKAIKYCIFWTISMFYYRICAMAYFTNMWPWTTKPVIRVKSWNWDLYIIWINNLSIDVWFVRIWSYLVDNYLKIWNLRVQKNLNIEKITFKVVQMKFLAMHITNKKIVFIYLQ